MINNDKQKKTIAFRIPANKLAVWQRFCQILEEEYGFRRGVLGATIIKLIEEFVNEYEDRGIDPLQHAGHTHTNLQYLHLGTQNLVKRRYKSLNNSEDSDGNNNNDGRRDRRTEEISRIKEAILEKYPHGSKISKVIVFNIIREVARVYDKRSLLTRFNVLLQDGFITPVDFDSSIYEICYKDSDDICRASDEAIQVKE